MSMLESYFEWLMSLPDEQWNWICVLHGEEDREMLKLALEVTGYAMPEV